MRTWPLIAGLWLEIKRDRNCKGKGTQERQTSAWFGTSTTSEDCKKKQVAKKVQQIMGALTSQVHPKKNRFCFADGIWKNYEALIGTYSGVKDSRFKIAYGTLSTVGPPSHILF